MAVSTAAASATVRPCEPIVSWVCEIGITPPRLVRPTVGLIPTRAQWLAGQTMDPSVSVASAAAAKLAAVAAAEPELEPHGLRSRVYRLPHWPPPSGPPPA